MNFNFSNFAHEQSARAMAQYLIGSGWETVAIAQSGSGASWAVTATISKRSVRGNEMAYLFDMCRMIDRHQDLLKAG